MLKIALAQMEVQPGHPDKNARKMLQLIAEAKEKQFKRIVWQVLEWNEPAINFYKKYNANFDPEWVNCSIDL